LDKHTQKRRAQLAKRRAQLEAQAQLPPATQAAARFSSRWFVSYALVAALFVVSDIVYLAHSGDLDHSRAGATGVAMHVIGLLALAACGALMVTRRNAFWPLLHLAHFWALLLLLGGAALVTSSVSVDNWNASNGVRAFVTLQWLALIVLVACLTILHVVLAEHAAATGMDPWEAASIVKQHHEALHQVCHARKCRSFLSVVCSRSAIHAIVRVL
jgi:hypothetical protein